LVSEIFDLKVADTHTHTQTFTSTDNKGRLKAERSRTNSTEIVPKSRRVAIGSCGTVATQ